MKLVIGSVATLAGVFFVLSSASANPALLPKHPGYPAKAATSPVNGQALANDPGQTNADGEDAMQRSAGYDDVHVSQQLKDPNNERITKRGGAGQLPNVQGPQIQIQPPVSAATKADASLGVK
jgi:hypothetical protein